MRLLACLAAVPALFAAWLWYTDRSIQHRLEPVASEIAGRQVKVDCQNLAGELLDAQVREGEVRYSAAGIPENRLFMTRKQCGRLRAFSGHAFHREVACLSGIDWDRPTPLHPGDGCYEKAASTIYALLVLAHEAYHTAGVTNEALTNCYAVQSMAYAAVRLGGDEREAALIARAMLALLPLQAGEYAMPDCTAGSAHDLWPETEAFPTESPLRAPMGRGGMSGVASGA